ncbi:MAG TPA: S-layer homology domain-containing protein [Chloroflexia bacterium]|nr:S-layer homology domain-containing protein [Chloroflexia bacterium]
MKKEKKGLWRKIATSRPSLLLGTTLLLTLLALPVVAQVGGGFNLSWFSVDGGSITTTSGGNFSMGGTVGQPDAGIANGGQYTWTGGFWGVTGSTATSTPSNTPTGTFIPPTATSTTTPTGTFIPPTSTNTSTSSVGSTATATFANTNTPTYTPATTATRTATLTTTGTATGVYTPAPAPIIDGDGDQQSAQIDGDIVVWEDNGAGNWDVKAKDLAGFVAFPIITATADQRYPAISGNLVVWQDNRNGDWDILAAYVTNHVAGTPFNVLVGADDQINPAVSGNVVVWQSNQGGRSDIVAKNLLTSSVITLTTMTTTNENPVIDGNIVVWQSKPVAGGPWHIDGYNLSTSTLFTVSQAAFDKTNPDISGHLIVWEELDSGSGNWHIMGANIAQQTPTVFPIPLGDDSNQRSPAIHGDRLVYQDSHPTITSVPGSIPDVHGRWTVFEYEFTPVPVAIREISNDRAYHAINPALSSNYIVWEQRRTVVAAGPYGATEDSDIYGTICTTSFTDVPPEQTFFQYVQWMSCRGYVGGYACGGEGEPCPGTYFRPNTNVTRGQLAKIISNAASFQEAVPPSQQTFADVPVGHTFWEWIERLASRGVISGYPCGDEGEPCDEHNRPYFRWGNNATRGQISKMVSSAASFDDEIPPTQQSFADVPPNNTFWLWIERLYAHGAIGGYSCGGEGEPCDEQNRPYFRPGNNTTRGQLTKIATVAFGGP